MLSKRKLARFTRTVFHQGVRTHGVFHDLPLSSTLKMVKDKLRNRDKRQAKAEQRRVESAQRRVDLLRAQLASCFTFADVAETEHNTGHEQIAARSLAHAEEGCSTLVHSLSNPKHLRRTKCEDEKELLADTESLRCKLDELRRLIGREVQSCGA